MFNFDPAYIINYKYKLHSYIFLRFLIFFRGSWVGAAMMRPLSLKKRAAHPLKLLGGRRPPRPPSSTSLITPYKPLNMSTLNK